MAIRINLDVMMAKRKMGLTELAKEVDITLANLSILKNGKAKAVRLETLNAICKALQCQPGDILEYVEDESAEQEVSYEEIDFVWIVFCPTIWIGGFHGDGTYFLALDCSQNKEVAMQLIKSWNAFPLSENLQTILYGSDAHSSLLAEESNIPEITNSYYYFCDRHSESTDACDDTNLFSRASYNFTVMIYDSNTDRLYYIEFDTQKEGKDMFLLTKTAIFNIGSFTLGLIAWGLAFTAIKSKKEKFAHVFSVVSFSLCAVSLVLQILEIENRFAQRDFAAIEDTIGAVIIAAVALVAVTMVLNVIAVIQKRSERGN